MSEQLEPLFDLTPTEDQQMMRDTVRKFASVEMREQAREADESRTVPDGFYDKVLELGFAMVQIPEEYGGMGLDRSPTGNMLLAEDLAEGDMSLAMGALSSLGFVNTVLDQGTDEQKKKYLPRFAEETVHHATVALNEPAVSFEPSQPKCSAKKDGAGYVLNGKKSMVVNGGSAELILVVADLEGEGPAAFVVESGTSGLQAEREKNMGLKPIEVSTLTLEGVKVGADAKLGGDAKFDLSRLVDLSRIGIAALAVGTCQSVLDYVKEYCNERVAFGEPITNRQSVAFMIADIAIELEGMRMLTWRAAAKADQGLDFHEEAYHAYLQAAEKGMKIGTDGVQLLGGHGFIREHPVELWYRNLRSVGILAGAVSI